MLISDDKYVYPNQKLKWEAKINIIFLRKKRLNILFELEIGSLRF